MPHSEITTSWAGAVCPRWQSSNRHPGPLICKVKEKLNDLSEKAGEVNLHKLDVFIYVFTYVFIYKFIYVFKVIPLFMGIIKKKSYLPNTEPGPFDLLANLLLRCQITPDSVFKHFIPLFPSYSF